MGLMYILEDGVPVREDCPDRWGEWMEHSPDRLVMHTKVDEVLVSTVFLGIDHAFNGGEPVLFETMIFGGIHDQYQMRYTSLLLAEQGHVLAVCMVESDTE